MPWFLSLTPLYDGGEYYTTATGVPPLNGSIFSPPNFGGGGTPIDTVTSGPPSTLSLDFVSAASPPAGPGTVLVTDPTTSGDLVRARLNQFPPSSPTARAPAALVTLPPALIDPPMLTAAITAAAPDLVLPPTPVPYWVRFASTLLTAGTWIPLVVSTGPPTATFGSGTITLTYPVNVAARVWYFSVQTYTPTLTLTYTAAPSHDPGVPSHILNIPLSSHRLVGVQGALALGLLLAQLISPLVQPMVNQTIVSTARNLMAQSGLRPTPTAVFSARSIRITPGTPGTPGTTGGINLQLALADLLGPAFVQGTLAVAVAPTPAAGVQRTYTVTVTNSVTGNAIVGATVRLQNYSATGASTVTTATTDAAGQATFTVTLRPRIITTTTVEVDIEGVLREREAEAHVLNPTLTVSAAPYGDVTRTLL